MRKLLRPWLLTTGAGLVLLAVLLATLHFTRHAPTERVVRVGVYENAPKIYTGPGGRPAGLFIDLLRPIARDEHWKLQFVHCDWNECLQKLRNGGIDLMPDVAYTADRDQSLDFAATAVAHAWSEVYARESLGVRSVSDLSGLRIALLRDSIQQYYFDRLMKGAGLPFTPVPVDSYGGGFRAVREGRADAVVSNNFFDTRHPVTPPLVETPIVFEPVGVYFATDSGRNHALLQAIDRHLAAWMHDPDSIYFKALRQSMAPAPLEVVPAWLRLGLLLAIGLMALFVAASLVLRWQVRQRTTALTRTTRHLDEVLRASPAVIYRLRDRDGQITPDWVSPNIQRLFGYAVVDVLKPDWWWRHLHPDDRERTMARMANLPLQGSMVHEYRFIDAQGDERYIRDEMHVTPAHDDQPRTVFGTWSDLTESRAQAERVDFLTYHDALTRLPNRLRLARGLTQAIERFQADDGMLAVLWIDLDRFKNINETLGHGIGDAYLVHVAETIRNILEPDDMFSRVGGDEFAVLLTRDAGVHHAIAMAERVLSVLSTPMPVQNRNLALTASIGISAYPSDGRNAETLLHNAEVAMYEAKNRGRNTWCLFDHRLSSRVVERLAMENALRGAIDRDELVLHYQPQVDLVSGLPVGIEALVRWRHPEIGLLPPTQFIGLAEECGVIDAIGAWVLKQTCRQLVAWRQQGLEIPSISVNLSVRQIEQGMLVAQVAKVLTDTGLDAESLELELTESMIMRDPEQSTRTFAALKRLGVKLSIDDFGTGHSSLAYLKQLPLDRIKIDRSFVRDIGRNPDDEAISRTVIELARQLGLDTVAEGVEREEQAAFLCREGCRIGQGFLYSKPLPADALAACWSSLRTPDGATSS